MIDGVEVVGVGCGVVVVVLVLVVELVVIAVIEDCSKNSKKGSIW